MWSTLYICNRLLSRERPGPHYQLTVSAFGQIVGIYIRRLTGTSSGTAKGLLAQTPYLSHNRREFAAVTVYISFPPFLVRRIILSSVSSASNDCLSTGSVIRSAISNYNPI